MSDVSQVRHLREGVFTIDGIMRPAECDALIERGEQAGFEAASINTSAGIRHEPSVRDNARLIEDDAQRAADLWLRVRPSTPAFLNGRQAIGLNERFRFYRYDPGQRFAGHVDAPFRRANGEQSLLTFMTYLNQDFSGGETAFGDLAVAPRTGMALLFRHELFHEGRAVSSGRKYVLRSDVMFNPPGRISQ